VELQFKAATQTPFDDWKPDPHTIQKDGLKQLTQLAEQGKHCWLFESG
jgi:hypothetical protein